VGGAGAGGRVFAQPVFDSGVHHPAVHPSVREWAPAGDRSEEDCACTHPGCIARRAGTELAFVAKFIQMVADRHRDRAGAKHGLRSDGTAELF